MDSNDLERERGITILAKVTSLSWKDTTINIVDTPGHADFGGEVERILNMVDGAVLLVDAAEGPMPQTKFVLSKALEIGLMPIVAINKIDKSDERHEEVVDEVFDLFAALDANEKQLDFPVLYGSAKNGWMALESDGEQKDMAPLFEMIVSHTPEPTIEQGSFRMLATTIEANPYLGRLLTGRVRSGTVIPNQSIKALSRDGKEIERGRVTKILKFKGLERDEVKEAVAGDIVSIAGLSKATVADTLCAMDIEEAIAAQPIDPPTLSMAFRINDGPYAGQEGSKVQSRVIRERLMREAEGNVALQIRDVPGQADTFQVSGRGELQLAILIETMRREGFELTVARPKVVMRTDEDGNKLEPVEEVIIDVDEEFSGAVVEKLSKRKAELLDMRTSGIGRQRLVFHAPTRGLIWYNSELMSDTRGTAIMNRLFHAYKPYAGDISMRHTGVLISKELGKAVAFALWKLEDRGPMFISPGDKVYPGMIIGEHAKGQDLEVNVLKGKQLTNMRASGKDDAVALTTPIPLTLEKALSYISDEEVVEITPDSIRLRKAILDSNDRKRAMRARQAEQS